MKTLLLIWTVGMASLLAPCATSAAEAWEASYAVLLKKYATPSGVRYQAWSQASADREALAALTRAVATKGPATPGREGELAYLINSYNIWTLHGVLEKYPVKSVRDIASFFGFFTQDRITISGKSISLNRLEKELILKRFSEPRVHFALNCASRSCPPLRDEPYSARQLDIQLEDATRRFLNSDTWAVQPSPDGKRVLISKIFDWYAADFKAGGGATAFLNKYRSPALGKEVKIGYLEYDWNLNDAR